jgi:hypothetical protein
VRNGSDKPFRSRETSEEARMTLTRRMAMGCSEGRGSRYVFNRLGSVVGGGMWVVDE